MEKETLPFIMKAESDSDHPNHHESSTTKLTQSQSEEDVVPPVPPLPQPLAVQDKLVDFAGPEDPYHPMNWPLTTKIIITLFYGLTTTWVTFASAVYSAGLRQISEEFHVNTETSASGVSLLVWGFALGPLLWAPLSEVYGRKWVVLVPYFIAGCFSFGTAVAKDIQTVLITRFFAGLFGSAPVTITGGALADIWGPEQRGVAIVGYGMCLVGGPTLGPVIGGAFVSCSLGWRWTEYLTGILITTQSVLDLFAIQESYAPVLLLRKARKLRFETNDWALHAKHEEWNVSLKELCVKYLIRPFQMLATPICLFMSIYAAFVYGILYANLEGFIVEFQEVRGWGPVVGALPFLALLVGMMFGAAINVFNNKYYFKKYRANGGKAVPEARLPPMMIGGISFAGGMFLFAWTSSPHINHWPSLIGAALTGLGFVSIFQSSLNYLIDTFTRFSASAVAANTFLRSASAGAFPLFITQLYHALGVDWGTTIFACIAVVLVPIPFLFMVYGRQLRARGAWSKPSVK